jgi:putative ATP-dependent endonuclease of OLD family
VKMRSVRIQNFRGFEDETVTFQQHTCLVGSNGAGKSTVLAALNVFFQEASSSTEVAALVKEDFHKGNTKEPVQITVTFDELSDAAKAALEHYVRHNELVVRAIATFDEETQRAPVEQKGERLLYKKYPPFFEDDRNNDLV